MTGHNFFLSGAPTLANASGLQLAKCISSFCRRRADWMATAADYYTAAAVYEHLSRLSDAELQRRGLSRADLARAVCAACERIDRSL